MADLSGMNAAISQGDSANASGAYGQAVTYYQAAGQIGADTVGPAIDKQSGGATAGLTQMAWDKNGLLHGLNNSDSAISDDAYQAKQFITLMMGYYVAANAYAANPAAHADVKLPALQPTGSWGPVTQPAAPAPAPVAAPAAAPKVAVAVPIAAAKPATVVAKAAAPAKSLISVKSALAAGGLGLGGFFVLGPLGVILGAAVGGLGSHYILKW